MIPFHHKYRFSPEKEKVKFQSQFEIKTTTMLQSPQITI